MERSETVPSWININRFRVNHLTRPHQHVTNPRTPRDISYAIFFRRKKGPFVCPPFNTDVCAWHLFTPLLLFDPPPPPKIFAAFRPLQYGTLKFSPSP